MLKDKAREWRAAMLGALVLMLPAGKALAQDKLVSLEPDQLVRKAVKVIRVEGTCQPDELGAPSFLEVDPKQGYVADMKILAADNFSDPHLRELAKAERLCDIGTVRQSSKDPDLQYLVLNDSTLQKAVENVPSLQTVPFAELRAMRDAHETAHLWTDYAGLIDVAVKSDLTNEDLDLINEAIADAAAICSTTSTSLAGPQTRKAWLGMRDEHYADDAAHVFDFSEASLKELQTTCATKKPLKPDASLRIAIRVVANQINTP